MQTRLKEATVKYRAAHKSHEANCLHYIKSSDSKHHDRVLSTEEQRCQGCIAKQLLGKLQGGNVTSIIHSTTLNGTHVLAMGERNA